MERTIQESIGNVVHSGIIRGIRSAIDTGCLGSAVILIYAGIDAMAFLGMTDRREDVAKGDFIEWVNSYISFPCKEQVTGSDLYGARCGMLHNYSAFSRMSRKKKCRNIGYMDKSAPEVRYNPEASKSLVLVSVPALAEAFYQGVDIFLEELFQSEERTSLASERLNKMMHVIPMNLDT
jgi:hypothetical protein